MTRFARIALVTLFVSAVAAAGTVAIRLHALAPAPTRQFVLVELFTSEGCSSCPPADDLLRRLLSTQPIDGVQVIALGQHVDYWDHQGWRDPFSSSLFTKRQRQYEDTVFVGSAAYTPQLIVDGAYECVASDSAAVRAMVTKAAQQVKGSVFLSATRVDAMSVRIDARVDVPAAVKRRGAADVVIAVTEDGLVNHVQRGENTGRTLAHSAVVRLMETAGRMTAGESGVTVSRVLKVGSVWSAANLRIVGFVQEQGSRRVLAAGSAAF